MWFKWLPWRLLASRLARSSGFIDPITVLSHLDRFGQPSEVAQPIELLRAGMIFHARGLINARAIQHNLDWVWPYWIEQQFRPGNEGFVPRAFSITHINLSHRNWTAVGVPDCDWLPIVDPRGLVTPYLDSWSIDVGIVPRNGDERPLFPSQASDVEQRLLLEEPLAVETCVRRTGMELRSVVKVVGSEQGASCEVRVQADCYCDAFLVASIRPVNPEGISFVRSVQLGEDGASLRVNHESTLRLDPAPDRVCMSEYQHGDALHDLQSGRNSITCDVGLATTAALYPLKKGTPTNIALKTSAEDGGALHSDRARMSTHISAKRYDGRANEGVCTLSVPDARLRFLFEAAVRNLVLHTPGEVYPGPFTYRRFWFRDAAFILHALLLVGEMERVRRALRRFPNRQMPTGYFHSQVGEWDSNGQVLWVLDRFRRLSGEPLPPELVHAVERGARWICRKRLDDDLSEPHAGLMPAGFSAEHFGPNDYYYWDDFWSAAGLRAAAAIVRDVGGPTPQKLAQVAEQECERFLAAIDKSLICGPNAGRIQGIPASPYRRMDSGAVGSLAAGYPLQLWDAHEPRLLATVEYLLENCMVGGGFFQDIIHSGINAYLTLHLAQVLLRAGDRRYWGLVQSVADLASPTGQWPEAIHPQTLGGCMGDGQHMWAAAEWVVMVRNCFVREEGDRLIVGSGLPAQWLEGTEPLRLGPTATPYGPITLEVVPHENDIEVRWEASWFREPPAVEVRLDNCEYTVVRDSESARVERLAIGRAVR